ncbi:MAG: hypothetical protein Q9186_002131 [Xanthomendoza sp. 1 TL-2023]
MAGKSSQSPLPPWGNALAGATGAVLANAVVYPLDIVKTRLQVQVQRRATDLEPRTTNDDHYTSSLDAIKKIVEDEGISGLYSGINGSLIGVTSTNFAYFYWYSVVRSLYQSSKTVPNTPGTAVELSLGAVAAAVAQIFTIPVSVVTTRQQTQPKGDKKGLLDTGREVVHSEDGWTGLWRGLKASLVLVVNPAITYGAYQRLRELLFPGKANLRPWESFFLGAVSKALATIATQPLIVAKVGLQSRPPPARQGKPFKSFVEVMSYIVEHEGPLALFKGLAPQVTKGILVQGLLMMTKERMEVLFVVLFAYIRKVRDSKLQQVANAAASRAKDVMPITEIHTWFTSIETPHQLRSRLSGIIDIMPTKRKIIEDFDPNKSDSADSTYGASTSKNARPRLSKSQRTKPPRKRQRRDLDGSDDISDDDDDISEDSFHQEATIEEEATDYDDVTGRPKRKAKEKRQTYQEPDSEDDIEDSASERLTTPKKRKIKQSRIIKLKMALPVPVPEPVLTPAAVPAANPTRRSTRARSGSVSARPSSAGPLPTARRSSRIAHDDTEPIIALTDSGHHANIVRPSTKSPPSGGRPRLGGKGPKKGPATSVVYEEEQSSGQTNGEPPEEYGSNQIDRIEVAASREDLGEDEEDEEDPQSQPPRESGTHMMQLDSPARDLIGIDEGAVIPESGDEGPPTRDEDEDEDPVSQPRRTTRRTERIVVGSTVRPADDEESITVRRTLRSAAERGKARSSQKTGREESSDFEPAADEAAEENVSDSEAAESSPRKPDDISSNGRRSTRAAKARSRSRRNEPSDEDDGVVADELAEELEDLKGSRARHRRRSNIIYEDKPQTRKRKPVDYRILRPDQLMPVEDDDPTEAATPSRRARGGGGGAWQRSLFSTYGPFGGAGGPAAVFGGPGGVAAAGGVDSDSSDDEVQQRPRAIGFGGTVGMTPTTGPQAFGLLQPQTHTVEPPQGPSGTPANLGKVKDKQGLVDADPLGIDQNVNFDSVGGLQGHIDQLKEMVSLPLLYPEIFQRFHVTPPRGVLFHGPPGTGKTLLARALASSVSSGGRKVTFYMRKAGDALSKWVGEAERNLRLLFEEARKMQPSIIFFDEIDGLAPVRSSKQDQIHSSIVSTLLALMDGMDGRGQVIIIGATNRPDSVDPALRRPGRFDREFYFPLPNLEARRSILDIHTKSWDPPLTPGFKDEIATLTKGYGGADLRALCTEAALNAVQRRYPQIYRSNVKLQIDPASIQVAAKDFMISVKKIVPSSERSTSSGAAPLPPHIEPLLRQPLSEIKNVMREILPLTKRSSALEEAEFEDAEDDRGISAEQFERSRVFRPRLLLKGLPGMGQQYLAAALLNQLEGTHVQSFDLPTLLSDSTRSAEAAVIQLFTEVRRHKPSIIYIPSVDIWFKAVGEGVISTFTGLLRTLAPTDPVMLLGIIECEMDQVDPRMTNTLFGFSKRNQFEVQRPPKPSRRQYFQGVAEYLGTSPSDFPEPMNRKKRRLEILPPVASEPEKPAMPTKAQLKEQKKRDRYLLNMLKLRLYPIMDQIKLRHKKFRTGVIDESQIRYLYEEEDPSIVSTDLPHNERNRDQYRPYEKGTDGHGEPGLLETATGRFFYNMEVVTIEKRLSNGYYKRPKDFLSDIKKLAKDAKVVGDADRLLKANELLSNVEVDMAIIETEIAHLLDELEQVYTREMQREKNLMEKQKKLVGAEERRLQLITTGDPQIDLENPTQESSGPVVLGEPMTNGVALHPVTPSNPSQPSQSNLLSHSLSLPISDLNDLQPRHRQSNGNSVPSRDNDMQISNSFNGTSTSPDQGTQDSSFGQSAQTRPFTSHTGAINSLEHRKAANQLTQTGVSTPMAEGSNPQDYTNYASTTTSSGKRNTGSTGEKTMNSMSVEFNTQSDKSNTQVNTQSDKCNTQINTQSDKSNTPNTQSSKGKVPGPNFKTLPEHPSMTLSQLPDTQPLHWGSQLPGRGSNSSSQVQSQTNIAPHNRPNTINALLNDDVSAIDPCAIDRFLDTVVDKSSGFSVEQLEQMYSMMMDKIWKTRGNSNRNQVVQEVTREFEDVLEDMEECQKFLERSHDDYNY